MAIGLRILAASFTVILLAGALPGVAADPPPRETRTFLVGGQVGTVPVPGPSAGATRCDFQCDFDVAGLQYLFVDVRGPEGDSFPYKWQLDGCSQVQPELSGHGRRFIWVDDCDLLTIVPAVLDTDIRPWSCTGKPLTKTTTVAPEGVPVSVTVPVSSDASDYTGIADCAPPCVQAHLPNPCLPNPRAQATGTVSVFW